MNDTTRILEMEIILQRQKNDYPGSTEITQRQLSDIKLMRRMGAMDWDSYEKWREILFAKRGH